MQLSKESGKTMNQSPATNSQSKGYAHSFADRHIGPRDLELVEMLRRLGLGSLEDLMAKVVPPNIRTKRALQVGEGWSEKKLLDELKILADKNTLAKQYIGLGYHETVTPPAIQRHVFENPQWYTAYTPYQAEIAQGRLEALLNFQTMVMELTGMEIANASLLDEGTAAAEAMTFCKAAQSKHPGKKFFVSENCHPHVIEVLKTRSEPLGIELEIGDESQTEFTEEFFACLLCYPDTLGRVIDIESVINQAKNNKSMVIVAADLLALSLLKPPGEMGADVVVGNTQRFGVPLGNGGPHAAYFATRDKFKRQVPGRIVGVSKDTKGRQAYRLALQTREQHIRREKATSNICTAQVLLANIASFYAVYHGPQGLIRMAEHIHRKACCLATLLQAGGFKVVEGHFFDTLFVEASDEVYKKAQSAQINFRRLDSKHICIALGEGLETQNLVDILKVFGIEKSLTEVQAEFDNTSTRLPENLKRTTEFMNQSVFHRYRSETELMRYITQLQQKDVTLAQSMIALGSCTMKLNAAAELMPVSWPGFNSIHPFAPLEQMKGYIDLINELSKDLADLTGFSAVSLQPNAGSQGEYAGLLVIKKYHESRGDENRNICLIPSSAHGTNPASAVMSGMKVVVVKCDSEGNIDLEDLRRLSAEHKENLAALMITYPSTHGVFEESITEICQIIHDHGGQVYMDGANMNALVGACRPAEFGADVAHLNLHKTFAIPHGGGGPGVGPIGVRQHLMEFLPTHAMQPACGPRQGIGTTTSAPWGSASILPISYAYIKMMGSQGLTKATSVAILNANYMAMRLKPHFPILYTGKDGWVAHECIVDVRGLKDSAGISVDDIAKRLIDYGFHAPTMSWPVAGTLMIEPTESESLDEIDRFCEAMIGIKKEADKIESGEWSKEDNPLMNAPHSIEDVTADEWQHSYSRSEAAYPANWVKDAKYWPPVSRIDNAHGDRNLVCSCPDISSYQ